MFFFVSFRIFFSDNTRVRILIFFHNLTLGYMTKTPPKSEYFFQQHWESEYFFLEKKTYNPPPWKLNAPFLR